MIVPSVERDILQSWGASVIIWFSRFPPLTNECHILHLKSQIVRVEIDFGRSVVSCGVEVDWRQNVSHRSNMLHVVALCPRNQFFAFFRVVK